MRACAIAPLSKIIIKKLFTKCFISTLLIILATNSNSQENGIAPALTFGVLPYLVPSHMLSTYGPASANLSHQTGLNINFRTASDYQKFSENLTTQKYDLAIIQPFDVQLAFKKLNYIPVAQVNVPLDTVFVSKLDSEIHMLSDLKGKTVAMAPKTAATSIVALSELENFGFELGKNVQIKFVKSHDACLHELVLNQANACATGGPPVDAFEKRTNTNLTIFHKTEPIPHMAFVVHKRVPEVEREKIRNAVLSWNSTSEGKEILQQTNFPGWSEASYEDYEMLEKFSSIESTGASRQSDGNLVFATFPFLPPKKLVEIIAPIPLRFSQVLDRKVHFRTALSYAKFRGNITENQYDIIMVHPFDFDIALKSGYKPVAQLQEKISAVFYVKSNSSVSTLDDLKGKTIAAPEFESAVARLAIQFLKKNSFVIEKDIHINYRKSHDSCIEQLMQDNVTACVTSSIFVERMMEQNKSIQLKKIAESETLPGLVILAHERLNTTDREKIKSDILSWNNTPAGRQLLRDTRFQPFGPVTLEDFAFLHSQ